MKKQIAILFFLLPVLAMSQGMNFPSVMLRSLDEKLVRASDLLQHDQFALVYFFDENSSGVVDQLEYLESLRENKDFGKNVRIISIYSASNGSYGNIQAFLNGNNIDIETYIDVNGELQRAMGLSDKTTILLSGFGDELTARYYGVADISGELTSVVLSSYVCENFNDTKASIIAP